MFSDVCLAYMSDMSKLLKAYRCLILKMKFKAWQGVYKTEYYHVLYLTENHLDMIHCSKIYLHCKVQSDRNTILTSPSYGTVSNRSWFTPTNLLTPGIDKPNGCRNKWIVPMMWCSPIWTNEWVKSTHFCSVDVNVVILNCTPDK